MSAHETTSWILGRGGMLGSALARILPGHELRPTRALLWGEPSLRESLRAAATELEAAAAERQGPWQVCWCAGASVVGSAESALARETETLRELLAALADRPALRSRRGTFLLVSSAGGVHGAGADARITERTAPAPISAYGRAKLEQERVLSEHAAVFAELSTLTARMSNLYGPGQRLDKPQGLISHMARAAILGSPLQIYVPFDTMRDYLFADDAARLLSAGLTRLTLGAPTQQLKLYAAERDTSVAGLLTIFRGVVKRRLKVVAGLHPTSLQQPRRLSFRSEVWPEDRALSRTDLVAGVDLVYRRLLQAFLAGKLAPRRL